MKSCLNLKSRFLDQESNESLFKGRDDPRYRIPMDGLALFIDKTWETIRMQKELNLPDQKIMVASLRCNELKEEALLRVEGMVSRLRERCENERVENFGDECRRIVN
jgi:hypothetical protein